MTVSLIVLAIISTSILTALFIMNNFNEKYGYLQTMENIVSENFYGDIDEDNMIDSILKGYISGLNDKYSRYLTADEYADEKSDTAGEMTGFGFTLQQDESGYIKIAGIMENSPASELDINIGDFIVAVNNVDVLENGFEKSMELMSDTNEKELNLTIRHDNKDKAYTLTRREIEMVTVTGEMLDNEIGYIKISGFKKNTYQQFREILDELNNNGAKGIIFDLRENGGGLLDSLEDCLDPLLPEGVIATAEYNDGHSDTIICSDASEMNIPMVVLVNGHTASAAELFTAALKDFGKAEVIGETTYGKGVMQSTIELSNGGAVVLTIAEYKTVISDCYDGVGITPDYIVENSDSDDQYNKAIEIITQKIDSK